MTPTSSSLLLHSAFYRFVPIADPVAATAALLTLARALRGSVVVASEGVSGALAGTPHEMLAFEVALQQPEVLGGALKGMPFKHSTCTTAPFGRLKVRFKPEIVALGLPVTDTQETPLAPPDEHDSSHIAPHAWRALLGRDDVVLLDNRNHFEYRLGHFRGALDPQVHNFRDLVAYVQQQAPVWREAQRPVAMYCTGGIRCDKTAPWLRSLGLQVWQLDGGVLNYFQQVEDAGRDWVGECFVFDKRIALDSHLQETGHTAEQVFDASHPDEAWRLQRALRLDASA